MDSSFTSLVPNIIFGILPSCEETFLAGECTGHECPCPWREFLCQDSGDFSTFRPLHLPCPSICWIEWFSRQSNRLNHSKLIYASLSRKYMKIDRAVNWWLNSGSYSYRRVRLWSFQVFPRKQSGEVRELGTFIQFYYYPPVVMHRFFFSLLLLSSFVPCYYDEISVMPVASSTWAKSNKMSMPDWWKGCDVKRGRPFHLIWDFLTKENSEVFCTTEDMVLYFSSSNL